MSLGAVQRGMRWREQLPEPGLLWIRWSPRPWPGPDGGVWTDLARSGLGWGRGVAGENGLSQPTGRCLEDLVYLPPGVACERPSQHRMAADLGRKGTPVLLQLMPGDEPIDEVGVHAVYDLMPALWQRDLEPVRDLPPGSAAVWPLIPGVTDAAKWIEKGVEALREAGVEAVLGVDLELSPGDRREVVVSHGEDLFDLLFHRRTSAERRFSRLVAGAGLRWWLERPLPAPPVLRVGNRRLAGMLLSIADLWSRLGRPPEQGQAFYRAARWIDESHYEVEALLRDGHLEVVSVIDAASRAEVADFLAAGRSSRLDELRSSWIAVGGDAE